MQSLVGFRRQALPSPALLRHPFPAVPFFGYTIPPPITPPSSYRPASIFRHSLLLRRSLFPSFFALLLFFPLPRCNRLRLLAIRACNTISRPATASTKRATLHSLVISLSCALSLSLSLFRSSLRRTSKVCHEEYLANHTRDYLSEDRVKSREMKFSPFGQIKKKVTRHFIVRAASRCLSFGPSSLNAGRIF